MADGDQTSTNQSQGDANTTLVSVGGSGGGIKFALLSGTGNWRTWKVQMMDLLGELEVWDVVDGTETEPSDLTMSGGKAWKKKDRKALGIIRRCVNDSILLHILAASNAKSAWDTLTQTYEVACHRPPLGL